MTSATHRFAAHVGAADWNELHDWSIADLDRFWTVATDFLGVR